MSSAPWEIPPEASEEEAERRAMTDAERRLEEIREALHKAAQPQVWWSGEP